MPSGISNTLKKYGACWIGSPDEKVVYLTFDEGYENGYTPKILDALKVNDAKAAFFITGRKEMKYLRPPKGEYSDRTLAVTRELDYHNIFWSMALVDWAPMPGGP